ncbi:FAD-dependent oxidoreductase [Nocardia sp. NPDC006044]|uniref:FAD-dependent oxidoreductase n=1 Tax=Nocardia sp. NPDC006044 TaxID=3364306 RepID=UPI00368CD03C
MNAQSDIQQTEVLIAGGGITGLSAALFLARAGIRPTLVERHASTALQPQARAFNPRSMEIFRALGLEPAIRDRTSILAGFPEMIGADTLAGPERFRVDILSRVRPPATLSPTDWTMIDQDELERVVRADAENCGADIRFGTELISFEHAADGVTALIRDLTGGTEHHIRADYLVAADGNRAGIRTKLGIGAAGPGELINAASFVFDADLSAALRDRRFLLGYFDQPTTGTALVPGRKLGRWALGIPFGPETGRSAADFTEARCVELTRRAIGDPGLDITLVPLMTGSDQLVATTRIGAWVADEYRAGRIFFAGDAAHVFPPTGSFGANTGIADAGNLAWKLAAVLKGQAGQSLLNSYADERRPVALITLDQAMQRLHGRHSGTGDDAATIDDLTMILGYRYRSAAVHTETGTPDEPVEDPHHPSGRPGLRAPHVWLRQDTTALSTLDLFDGGFTLLTGAAGTQWRTAAEKAVATMGLDLSTYCVGTDFDDIDDKFGAAYGLTATGAALIRPDGFVAWRAPDLPANPEHELLLALSRLLDREAGYAH